MYLFLFSYLRILRLYLSFFLKQDSWTYREKCDSEATASLIYYILWWIFLDVRILIDICMSCITTYALVGWLHYEFIGAYRLYEFIDAWGCMKGLLCLNKGIMHYTTCKMHCLCTSTIIFSFFPFFLFSVYFCN